MKKPQYALDSGTRIGSYEINHVLGIGGFGITYKGYDHTLECHVAIKEYLPGDYASRNLDKVTVIPQSKEKQSVYYNGLEQFLREARTLAKFKTPNVVRVTRYLETNGTAYIVMDYEDGEPLSRLLKSRRKLSEREILNILIPVLHGLKVIHDQQVLHRDVKPSNIYLRKSGVPVLLDFGAARQAFENEEKGSSKTVTPGYAPFEQYDGRSSQGPWTDIYGVGATLYHCITGKAPAPAPERMAAMNANQLDPVLNLQRITNNFYSMELLDIVNWMLKPIPQERPQSADVILERLAQSQATSDRSDTSLAQSNDNSAGPNFNNSETIIMWTNGLLEEAEQDLAKYMGPLAKVLVPQAAYKSGSVDEFLTTLANAISSKAIRNRFLKSMRSKVDRLMPDPIAVSRPSSPSRTSVSSRSETSVASDGSFKWDVTILKNAEEKLATYVGPLAQVLVKNAAKRAVTVQKLHSLLAFDIPDGKERKKFLDSVNKK